MNSPSFRSPGTQATLRGVKNKVYWAYPVRVVQYNADLIALYLAAGTLGKNVEKRPTAQDLLTPHLINIVDHQWTKTDVLFLIVPGDAFSAYLMWDAETKEQLCWYINLQEPIRRTMIGFDTMDTILDIVVTPDLSEWKWKDEDEFTDAQRRGVYTPERARTIRAEGERAIRLLTSERRVFYTKWKTWQADPAWEKPKLSSLWDKPK